VTAVYEALKVAYPFPDDTRIFLREWPAGSISQNGVVAPDPVKPVFMAYVPQGAGPAAMRRMLRMLDAAVTEAYTNSGSKGRPRPTAETWPTRGGAEVADPDRF